MVGSSKAPLVPLTLYCKLDCDWHLCLCQSPQKQQSRCSSNRGQHATTALYLTFSKGIFSILSTMTETGPTASSGTP